MSEEERTPEEWEDEFEAVLDDPDQDFLQVYVDPEVDLREVPKFGSLREAYEDYMRRRGEKESNDD